MNIMQHIQQWWTRWDREEHDQKVRVNHNNEHTVNFIVTLDAACQRKALLRRSKDISTTMARALQDSQRSL